jgi:hypothetical protein
MTMATNTVNRAATNSCGSISEVPGIPETIIANSATKARNVDHAVNDARSKRGTVGCGDAGNTEVADVGFVAVYKSGEKWSAIGCQADIPDFQTSAALEKRS